MTTSDPSNRHNLFYAAENGNVNEVNALLAEGFHVNDTSNDKTPIYFASRGGHVDVVQALLDNGADVNFKTWIGETPLHMAAENDHEDTVSVLLDAGADIDDTDDGGQTALLKASKKGNLDVIELLLEKKSDVTVCDKFKKTCLHHLIENTHSQKDSDDNEYSLPDLNIDDDDDDDDAYDDDHQDIELDFDHDDSTRTMTTDNVDAVRVLVQAGASVNAADRYGQTPLHMASERGLISVVTVLIEEKADIDAKDEKKSTALIKASYHGCLKVVDYLLEQGADVNAQDDLNKTSLHHCLDSGYTDVAHTLLGYVGSGQDINIDIKDKNGRTPLKLVEDYCKNHPTAKTTYYEILFRLLRMGATADLTIKETLEDAGNTSKVLFENTEGKVTLMEMTRPGIEKQLNKANREGTSVSAIVLNDNNALSTLNTVFRDREISAVILFNVDFKQIEKLEVSETLFYMSMSSFEPNRAMEFALPIAQKISFIDVQMPKSWYVESPVLIDVVQIIDCTGQST